MIDHQLKKIEFLAISHNANIQYVHQNYGLIPTFLSFISDPPLEDAAESSELEPETQHQER